MIWENNKEIGVNMMLEILWKCRTTIKKGSFSYNEQRKENKGINQQTAPTTLPKILTQQNSETLGECDPKLLHYPKNKGHAAPSGPAEFTTFCHSLRFRSRQPSQHFVHVSFLAILEIPRFLRRIWTIFKHLDWLVCVLSSPIHKKNANL